MGKIKILLMDTSRFYLELNKEILDDPALQIIFATDCQQAYDIVATAQPDLIVMDIAVARLDKSKFCSWLSTDPQLCKIPVIMIVDADIPEDIEDAVSIGCQDYIVKPCDRQSLIDTVHRHLPAVNRRAPRVRCNIPVVLQLEGRLVMVPCENISVEGMFVKSSLSIKPGSEVLISFRLPGLSSNRGKIKAKGHVVWINNTKSLTAKIPVGFGIQIDEIVGEKVGKRRHDELMAFVEANRH